MQSENPLTLKVNKFTLKNQKTIVLKKPRRRGDRDVVLGLNSILTKPTTSKKIINKLKNQEGLKNRVFEAFLRHFDFSTIINNFSTFLC